MAGSIRRANIDGTNPVTLMAGLNKPMDLELDSWHGRIYWLDGDADLGEPVSIMSTMVDGSDVQTLLTGQTNTRDFELDARNGHIYWATGSANYTIYRADYARDGSALSGTILLKTNVNNVVGLGLKPDQSTLFWTDGNTSEIWQGPLFSGARTQLAVTGLGLGLNDITAVYPYYYDLPLPTATVISPTDGATINSYQLITVTGVITAPAFAKEVHVEQLIGGLWTEVYSQTYVTGEATVDTWAFTWVTPTMGYPVVGSHDFRIRVEDWGNDSSTTPFTLSIEPPPSGLKLPPDLAPLHIEILNPPNGAIFTSADPITFTAGAAAEGYLLRANIREEVTDITFYQDTWSLGEAVTTTITAVWTPPPVSGTYLVIMSGVAFDGGIRTITNTVIIDLPPPPADEPAGYVGPLLDSVVLYPTNGTVLPDLNTTTLTGTANARDSLQSLSVRVDDIEVFNDSWANGAANDVSWSTNWTPPADGVYVIDSIATDWSGRMQTETHPITITVDSISPAIEINPTMLTSTHQASVAAVVLQGTADGSPGELVEMQIDGNGWQPVAFNGVAWQTEWLIIEDGQSFSVQARITDKAGRTSQDSQIVTVDVLPPEPVDIILGYLDGTLQAIEAGDTVYKSNPSLVVDWSAGTDGSGIGRYMVGWTTSPTPSASALSEYLPADPRQHQQVVADLQILYAHVGVYDAYGNVEWQTIGPVYIDDVETPDLIADTNYDGWQGSGSTLLGADYELFRKAPESAANNNVQRFFMTWDAAAIRLAWEGADWTHDGDLYIYLNSTVGGAIEAYDPNSGITVTVTLPDENGSAMAADYLLYVEDESTVTLLEWDGTAWNSAQVLSTTHYLMRNGVVDVRLPFSWLSMSAGDPLQVVAFATEEDSLRLWAAAPNQNPLNSKRVVSELAQGRDLSTFALTQYYDWAALASNLEPNANQLAAADLRLSITSSPAGVQVGYLQDDLLDLLLPDGRLDADLDGVIDFELPFDTVVIPQGDGQPISYTITYTNAGSATATAVQLVLDAYGAVNFSGSSSTIVNIGDVAPGTGGTVMVQAFLDAGQDAESGEMIAAVSDASHASYDWFWVQHSLDAVAPTGLTIESPIDYVIPLTQTIYGLVQDMSSIAEVQVEVRLQPAGTVTTLSCPDGNRDGLWTCPWNTGSLSGVDNVELRAKAVDVVGNESSWTAWHSLTVDLEAPVLTLDTAVDDALADGFLSPGEFLISGGLTDNIEAESVELCLQSSEDLVCTSILGQGALPTSSVWEMNISNLTEGDGISQTMALAGLDGAGNHSNTITRTYQVDTIGPMITVTQLITVVSPEDISNNRTLVGGFVSDGGGVAEVVVRLSDENGNVYGLDTMLADNEWSVDLAELPFNSRQYWMSIEAIDNVGNVQVSDSYALEVNGLAYIYLPIIRK